MEISFYQLKIKALVAGNSVYINDCEFQKEIENLLKRKGFKVLTTQFETEEEQVNITTNEAIEIIENTFEEDPEDCGFEKTWTLIEE